MLDFLAVRDVREIGRTEDGVGFRSGSDDGRRICALDIRTLRCATEMVQQWAIPNLETQTGESADGLHQSAASRNLFFFSFAIFWFVGFGAEYEAVKRRIQIHI